MITISNLNLILKQTHILKDVSFTLHSGEILGITGPSGCGKSSLLKLLSDKKNSYTGKIKIKGEEISEFTKKKLRSETSALLYPDEFNPESTVFEEVIRGRIHLKKMLNPYSEIDRDSTQAIIDETGLSEKSIIRLKRSSDSTIRMALIARTINSGSDIIILDSPEQGLDPSQKLSVIRALKKYTVKGDKSVLIASSDIDFLVKICDRIIVFKEGEIFETGGCDIITEDLMKKIFGIDAMIVKNIITGLPEIHIINNE